MALWLMALPYKRVYGSAISLPGVNTGVAERLQGGTQQSWGYNPFKRLVVNAYAAFFNTF
jgi:hypothetical protein